MSKSNIFSIKHLYAKEALLPLIGITENINFFEAKDPKVMTADGFVCKITQKRELHILSDEAKLMVSKIYKMTVHDFLMRWYQSSRMMSSMIFVHLTLEKEEQNGE